MPKLTLLTYDDLRPSLEEIGLLYMHLLLIQTPAIIDQCFQISFDPNLILPVGDLRVHDRVICKAPARGERNWARDEMQ